MSNQVSKPQQTIDNEELTLKELIEYILEYWREFVKYWWILALVAALFALGNLVRTTFIDTEYIANMTFMVNEVEGEGGGGIGSLLGQFGFGGGAKGGYNLEKIAELSRSRNIIQKALFTKQEINGKKDFLSNHLLAIYGYQEIWEKDSSSLMNFQYRHDSIPVFTREENKVLKILYSRVIGSKSLPALLELNFDDATSIFEIDCKSLNEEFSGHLLHEIYTALENYYVSRTIEPQQKTYNTIKAKVDSLEGRLQSLEYSIAKYKDSSYGLIDYTADIQDGRYQRDMLVTGTAYGEAVKNLEFADFQLRIATPFFQIIDAPIFPLSKVTPSKSRGLILGAIVGLLLAVAFFAVRKLLRDVMQAE